MIQYKVIYPSCDQKKIMIYSLQFIEIPDKSKYRRKKKINKSIKGTRRIHSDFIYKYCFIILTNAWYYHFSFDTENGCIY